MHSWRNDKGVQFVPLMAECLSKKSLDRCSIPTFLNQAISMSLCDYVKESKDRAIVIDLDGIELVDKETFIALNSVVAGKDVLVADASKMSEELIRKELEKSFSAEINTVTGRLCFLTRHTDGPTKQMLLSYNKKSEFTGFIRSLIGECFIDFESEERFPSSNVMGKRYFSSKFLHLHPSRLMIAVSELALAIERKFGSSYEGIVTSSYNGTMIAVLLGQMLKRPVTSYVNLGPKTQTEMGLSWKRAVWKKSLHVVDMVCMGSETRVAEVLVASLGGSVIGTAGIATYIDPVAEKQVFLADKAMLTSHGYSLRVP